MDIMIDLGMHLPAVFVKDVCYKCGVSREVRCVGLYKCKLVTLGIGPILLVLPFMRYF